MHGRIAAADRRQHIATVRIGDDGGRFQVPGMGQAGNALAHSCFGRQLHRGRQGGVDGHALAVEGEGIQAAAQLHAHHVHEGRVAVAGQAGALGDRQRLAGGITALGLVDQAGPGEMGQHQVAALQGPLRMPPRIEPGGPWIRPTSSASSAVPSCDSSRAK